MQSQRTDNKYTGYQYSDDGNESGYESDGKTKYKFKKDLGTGAYAKARLFQSEDKQKEKAILAPLPKSWVDFDEAKAKYSFFQALYPNIGVKLINEPNRNTYRLVLPFIPGEPYDKLQPDRSNSAQQIELFLYIINALEHCHLTGYVVIDLNGTNIHYDSSSVKSYLIDGGLSAKEGDMISSMFYVTQNEAIENRKKWPNIAPECWSTKIVMAHSSMDIYSFGRLMERFLSSNGMPIPAAVGQLIESCTDEDPEKRPTLYRVKLTLKEILSKEHLHTPSNTLTLSSK